MNTSKTLITIFFWFVVIIISFVIHQIFYEYHFFYLEQFYLFLFDSEFVKECLLNIGGFADVVSRFLQQFFIQPYMGAIIISVLLGLIGVLMNKILLKINESVDLIALPLLTMASIAFLHFDHNYLLSGTIALIVFLLFFNFYLNIKKQLVKTVFCTLTVIFLYLAVGSTAVLFIISVILLEVFQNPKQSYYLSIPLIATLIMIVLSGTLGWTGEWIRAYTPSMYYSLQLDAPMIVYLPWLIMLASICVSCLLSKYNLKYSISKFRILNLIIQIIVVVGFVIIMTPQFGELQSLKYKKLHYYTQTKQWEKVIEESKLSIDNYLYNCYLNIALAETGHLGNDYFRFDQKGVQGIVLQWDRSLVSSLVMSDLHFALRNPAEAQRVSFEANIIIAGKGSAHLYKKLVQTNLVFGNYAVAEKYISLLEKTLFYKDWATRYRGYLHNDKMIENDAILKVMRKSIPKDDSFFGTTPFNQVLEKLVDTNPNYSVPIEFLGLMYLSTRNMEGFNNFLEKYYGTIALPQLPRSFQEAVFVLSEHDTKTWEKYDLPIDLARDFLTYRQYIKSNNENSNFKQQVKQVYGHTYWFYYMY